MSGIECDDSGTFSAIINWNTVIDSSTVIPTNGTDTTDADIYSSNRQHNDRNTKKREYCKYSNHYLQINILVNININK